jgi:hypothetical protein
MLRTTKAQVSHDIEALLLPSSGNHPISGIIIFTAYFVLAIRR